MTRAELRKEIDRLDALIYGYIDQLASHSEAIQRHAYGTPEHKKLWGEYLEIDRKKVTAENERHDVTQRWKATERT